MAPKNELPRYHELIKPTLAALKDLGDSASVDEIDDWIADHLKLSPTVRAMPHGEGPSTELKYRLRWARTYLKIYGAVINSERGVWAITDLGKGLTDAEIATVPKAVRAAGRTRKSKTPDLTERAEVEEAVDWTDQLLGVLTKILPAAFERLCQRLLRESGFTQVEVTGKPGDGGIDGVGVLRVNLVSFHVLFQCKRYKGSVGPDTVRNFRGAMQGRADKGLIITTGTFTAEARREATRDGAPAIDLVDGERLCVLLKDLKLGVDVELVEKITVKESFFSTL